jgi:hypothetical protein
MSRFRCRAVLAAGLTSLLATVAIAGTAAATTTTEPDGEAVQILPPDEPWEGLTRGELLAQWWQRAVAMPQDISPYTDPTGERCGYQQAGPVFLLPGNLEAGMVARRCFVAEGTAIFVYVSGSTCGTVESPPYFRRTVEELQACVDEMVGQEVLDFRASVNGQDIADLNAYLTTSPPFTMTLPENNMWGLEPGVSQEMAASYNFIIAPPPPGQYTIHTSETIAGRPRVDQITTIIVEAPQITEPTGTTASRQGTEGPEVTAPPPTT